MPYRFNPPLIKETGSPIVALECGWDIACALTEAGDAFFWRPLENTIHQKFEAKVREAERSDDPAMKCQANDNVVKCMPWELNDETPICLPPIPGNLPALRVGGESGITAKLVKIASGDHFILGLTNGGHVLCIDVASIWQPSDRMRWTYVSTVLSPTGAFHI